MADSIADFHAFRTRMNDLILGAGNLTINRFFALDHRTYEPGALGTKTKEMLGLVSSMVLRCDDCVTYHVVRCHEEGVTREEFLEIFSVGLVVGGSIVIPHLRRARARWETAPETTFPMSDEDHDRFLDLCLPPSAAELSYAPIPSAPAGCADWFDWAVRRWPTLPRFDTA